MQKPITQYTKSGRINIAYQVFGSGSTDLVYIPGWVSNIDWMWACPELVNFLQELGKITRVILFDKRGTGLSDRISDLSTLEERMDDIRAVMDAVGSKSAVLFGHSEGGSASALFAATYPERVISLIAFGIFAKRRYAPDYPWAPTDTERQKVYDMIENCWGGGEMNLVDLVPSKADDKQFMDWLANYFRSGASPSAALALTKMNTEIDIIDILGSIKVPTLLMQRTHDIDVKIEEGRFIAKRIKGAKLVEFDGDDHLFWAGNTQEVLKEIKHFIFGLETFVPKHFDKQLFSIVVGKTIFGKMPFDAFNELTQMAANQFQGQVVFCKPDRFMSAFKGPSKAVNCGLFLMDMARTHKVQLSVGVHIEEMDEQVIGKVESDTEAFFNVTFQQETPNQVLVTQSVKYLLSATGFHFVRLQEMLKPLSGEVLPLFRVIDKDFQYQFLHNNSLLEEVMKCINTHMVNEQFGVEMLCRELGMSERQLQRKLKAMTNKTPNQLIVSVRLHKAKELLQQNTYNISEVAYLTGFSNPSYFSKRFKQEFDITPSSFV